MQKILLLGILVLMVLQGKAQENNIKNSGAAIAGKIVDSISAKPIEYATITLFTGDNKKPVNGAVTNLEGNFKLTALETGNYKILVECLGYQPYTISNVQVNKKTGVTTIATIMLAKKAVMLQGVTVSSSAGLIENKIDKLVFNAEKDITSQSGVATDILKKVPQVSVDVDGNVQLAGSSSIRFLINGKPSTAFGSSITDVLQSIPASQIKSIEVITNPGAKYDAQGLGGIINIILKSNRVKGINGNIALTAGTLNENGSLNFNARKGNFGINAFASGNTRIMTTVPVTSQRLSVDTAGKKNISLQQDANSHFKRHGAEAGAGFDWTYKKKNNFTGSVRYGDFGYKGNGITNQQQIITDQGLGTVLSSIASINHNDYTFDFNNTDISLNYKRTFDKEDQELEISLNSSKENNGGTSTNYQLLQPQDSLYFGTSGNNPGVQKEKELQIDYTQPLKKDVVIGVGGKINSSEIISNAAVYGYKTAVKNYLYDSSLSNKLDYKQNVYALYGEISFPVAKLFDTKLGGRYERTEINSFYSNAQQQAGQHGYNTFVPSIFFSKKLSDSKTIKLSYSKRIERPDYMDLNPYINTTDPKNISAGNPYLLPEIGHRFELGYSKNFEKAGSFSISAFYRNNHHDIQPFIVYYTSLKVGDSVYTNVAVSTRQNIGTENNMGINAYVDLHFDEKLSIRSNLAFFKRHTINAIDAGYNSNSFNYRINMNASYQFSKTLAGEFFGNFNSPRHEAQGKYPSFTSYSMAIRKQIWNKKGSVALSATNPFSQYVKQATEVFGPNFTVNSTRRIPFRQVSLNFTWKFGRLEFKKDKEENRDVAAPAGE
jgi:outer membrane receptor protein involved in Fe transport